MVPRFDFVLFAEIMCSHSEILQNNSQINAHREKAMTFESCQSILSPYCHDMNVNSLGQTLDRSPGSKVWLSAQLSRLIKVNCNQANYMTVFPSRTIILNRLLLNVSLGLSPSIFYFDYKSVPGSLWLSVHVKACRLPCKHVFTFCLTYFLV